MAGNSAGQSARSAEKPMSAIDLSHTWLITLIALLIERIIGYPAFVYRIIGHPAEWIGKLIAHLEERWNNPDHKPLRQKLSGIITVFGAGGTDAGHHIAADMGAAAIALCHDLGSFAGGAAAGAKGVAAVCAECCRCAGAKP